VEGKKKSERCRSGEEGRGDSVKGGGKKPPKVLGDVVEGNSQLEN